MSIKKVKKVTFLVLCFFIVFSIWLFVQVVPAIVIYSNSNDIQIGMTKEQVMDSMNKKPNGTFKHFSGDAWYKKILLGDFWVKVSYDKKSCFNQEVSTVCASGIERRYFFLKGNHWFLAYDLDNL
ncbi:MAG: hypothetical protein ACRBEE_00820 [Arenicella sp.]